MAVVESRGGMRWFLLGLTAWTAVALLWVFANGLQRMSRGASFVESAQDLGNTLALVYMLAALSPLVFFALQRVASRRVAAAVPLYFVLGAAYWLAAGASHAGLIQLGIVRGEPACGVTVTSLLFRCGFRIHLLFAAMVLLHAVVRHMREVQRREVGTARLQAELSRARTAALRAELHPHFLFNTLHVVSGLMNQDVGAARRVLGDLSELLRRSLAQTGSALVPLGDEIQLVERYLAIQKARFRDRLETRFRIEEGALGWPVPSLLLQPLVENAIQHGIGRKPDGGRIEVAAARENGHLLIRVSDNGAGLPPGEQAPEREGIGIGATRTRLQLLYGARAALRFVRPAAGGCEVEVMIPAQVPGGRG